MSSIINLNGLLKTSILLVSTTIQFQFLLNQYLFFHASNSSAQKIKTVLQDTNKQYLNIVVEIDKKSFNSEEFQELISRIQNLNKNFKYELENQKFLGEDSTRPLISALEECDNCMNTLNLLQSNFS